MGGHRKSTRHFNLVLFPYLAAIKPAYPFTNRYFGFNLCLFWCTKQFLIRIYFGLETVFLHLSRLNPVIRASVAKLCALYCKYFLLFGAKSLKVHQKSIIRTLYLLQVSGSDLLFISRFHRKQGLHFCKPCSIAIKI